MASIYDMADTWNNGATTFTAIKMNVTDTASNAASLLLDLQVGGSSKFKVQKNGLVTFTQGIFANQVALFENYNTAVSLSGSSMVSWGEGIPQINTLDTAVCRSDAGVVGVRGSSFYTGGALEFLEQTAPSAPGANAVRLYAQDNGAGKTQLMALFNTGAAQQVAIEP